MSGIVGAGHDDDLIVSLVGLGVGSFTIDVLQVLVGILVAGTLGIDIHVVVHGLHSGLLFLAQSMTGLLGGIIQSISTLSTVDGGGQEVVCPGFTSLLVGLSAQGSRGI